MKKADQQIADKILSHQISLMRFSAGEKKKVFSLFLQMQAELKAKLQNGFTSFEKERITKLLKECTAIINGYYTDVQSEFDFVGLAKAEAAASTKAMASIGLNASVPTAAVLKAMVSDTLLTGAPLKDWWAKQAEDTAFKFASQVRQGVAQGETLQQIITRVVGNPRKGIAGIMDVPQRNASTLVHDSIMQIANDAKMTVFRENADILKGVQQLSTLDSRTSAICIAYSGAQWDLEGNPINGTTLPFDGGCPRHPNCLAGDTVISATGISKHYKRWFDGEVVVLSIAGIDDVTITPNHPVLTDHGWVAAGLLKNGDNLVFCEDVEATMLMLNPNNYNMETSIKDIGNSLLMSGGMMSPVMPTTTEDFHGDGIINGEVDIILADSLLTNNRQTRRNKLVKKLALTSGHFRGVILNALRSITQFFKTCLAPPAGFLCFDGAGSASIGTSAGSLNNISLADVSNGKAEAYKHIPNNTVMPDSNAASNIISRFTSKIKGMKFDNFAIAKELLALYGQSESCKSVSNGMTAISDTLRDISDRLSRHIGLVKLQNVTVRKYASHVYNLQSELGWYIVNITQPQYKNKGIIVHNCRSVMVPITKTYREMGIDIDEREIGTRASDLGQVPADMSFDSFLKRHDTAYQDELLGKGKAKMWREGKITLKDLVSQNGRPLTLEQLQAGL